jgi:hypothetical protein
MSEFIQRERELNGGEPAVLAFKIDATGSPDPKRSVRCKVERVDDAVRKSNFGAITLELAAVVAIKAVLSANPEISGSILLDTGDIWIAEPL